jgi:nucleoside diphosphate kinase
MTEAFPDTSEWARLTVVPQKQKIYARDLYFRECWADMANIFGADVPATLAPIAMMNVKPDAVVGRRMTAVLDFVLDHGYRVIAARTVGLTRASMREVWRYDWDVYPVDRLAFSTIWYTSADVLLLILEDRSASAVPATARLSDSKGNALPEKRAPEHMRTLLRPPNRILNFVHVAEEPADIVRELGIWFDRPERRALLAEIAAHRGADRRDVARAAIAELEARYPTHDLDFAASLARLERASPALASAVHRLRDRIRDVRQLSWSELTSMIDPADPNVNRWDFITVASNVIPYEREIDSPAVPAADASKWVAAR